MHSTVPFAPIPSVRAGRIGSKGYGLAVSVRPEVSKTGEHAASQISTSTLSRESSEITPNSLGVPDLSTITGQVEGLDSYPLNLLSDMAVINMSAITFLFLMVNVFIAIPDNMSLIKNTVTLLFSEMYFNKPYLKLVHRSLLTQLINILDIYGYPIEYEDSVNKTIKSFKKVVINEEEIIKINYDFINKDILFDNKYYLFIQNFKGLGKKVLIPAFPPIINENIKLYREILRKDTAASTYLIS